MYTHACMDNIYEDDKELDSTKMSQDDVFLFGLHYPYNINRMYDCHYFLTNSCITNKQVTKSNNTNLSH